MHKTQETVKRTGQSGNCPIDCRAMQELPTLSDVRRMLANRPRSVTLEDVAKAADVSVSWVKQVISGEIEEPAYNKVAAVYAYLLSKGNAQVL